MSEDLQEPIDHNTAALLKHLLLWELYGPLSALGIACLDSLAKFDPQAETRWLVVDRKHSRGLVATFTSPAMFSYHTVNTWREDGDSGKVNIFCDLIQYPNLDNLHALYYDNLMSIGPKASKLYDGENDITRPIFTRYCLASVPKASTSSAQSRGNQIPKADLLFQLPAPLIGELPAINPLYRTSKSRYVYSVVDRGLSSFNGLVKTDLETKGVPNWEHAKHTPGEVILCLIRIGAREKIAGGY